MNNVKPWDLSGSIALDDLICRLYSDDRGEFLQVDPISAHMALTHAQATAWSGTEQLELYPLPKDELPDSTKNSLLHERVHYWQMLSSALLQVEFLWKLERLRSKVSKNGGAPGLIIGFNQPNLIEDDEAILHHFQRTKLDSSYREWPDDQILSFPTDGVVSDPRVFDGILHRTGATCRFWSGDKRMHIPLTRVTLIEGAAHLSTKLATDELILINSFEKETRLYNAAWLQWMRIMEDRYPDPRSAAEAFLATVDLALMGDAFRKEASFFEGQSAAVRFGMLLSAARIVEPLDARGDDWEDKVRAYQNALCKIRNWPTVEEVALKMARYLSKSISVYQWYLHAIGSHLDDADPEFIKKIEEFLKTPLSEQTASLDDLFQNLAKHSESGIEDRRIGLLIVRQMIKACAARIEHPGLAALPHRDPLFLEQYFPLPLCLYNSTYYFEHPAQGSQVELTHHLPATQYDMLALDCVRLGALSGFGNFPSFQTIKADPASPVALHESCGFIDRSLGARCWFTLRGFGCPGTGLTDSQAKLRGDIFLHDWCHWKTSAHGIGLDKDPTGRETEAAEGPIDYQSAKDRVQTDYLAGLGFT